MGGDEAGEEGSREDSRHDGVGAFVDGVCVRGELAEGVHLGSGEDVPGCQGGRGGG